MIEHRLPVGVADGGRSLSRADEVGEEHRCEKPLRWWSRRSPTTKDAISATSACRRRPRTGSGRARPAPRPRRGGSSPERGPTRSRSRTGCRVSVKHERRGYDLAQESQARLGAHHRVPDPGSRGRARPVAQALVPIAKLAVADSILARPRRGCPLAADVGAAALHAASGPRFPIILRDQKRLVEDQGRDRLGAGAVYRDPTPKPSKDTNTMSRLPDASTTAERSSVHCSTTVRCQSGIGSDSPTPRRLKTIS